MRFCLGKGSEAYIDERMREYLCTKWSRDDCAMENITENKPVMYLFSGAAQMAIASGADIIPVAVERYGDSYYVNIGENIECKDGTLDDKEKLTERLRDTLATLKWEIWERKGMCKRCTISPDYSDMFLKEIIGEKNTSYTVEDVWNTMYRPDNKLEY
ncbi:MAG: hypothetical protein ACI4GD_04985 [Lachnospiraceae bacterium]